jgi:hypothetical protein
VHTRISARESCYTGGTLNVEQTAGRLVGSTTVYWRNGFGLSMYKRSAV